MGLDISAYSRLQNNAGEDAVRIWRNPDFPGRADDLQDGGMYIPKGTLQFRAGSYSGYNEWREQLAKLAGYPAVTNKSKPHSEAAWQKDSGPFWELINFSDCEGTLGSAICAKLAKDFDEFEERAAAIGGWFFDRYQLWQKAAHMAADNGAICFH